MEQSSLGIIFFLASAFLYTWRGYEYTKLYYNRRFGLTLGFWKIYRMIITFAVDYRLIFFLPIFKDEYMDRSSIYKSNIILAFCLGCLLTSIIIDMNK